MLQVTVAFLGVPEWGSQNRNGAGEAKQRLRSPRGGNGPEAVPRT